MSIFWLVIASRDTRPTFRTCVTTFLTYFATGGGGGHDVMGLVIFMLVVYFECWEHPQAGLQVFLLVSLQTFLIFFNVDLQYWKVIFLITIYDLDFWYINNVCITMGTEPIALACFLVWTFLPWVRYIVIVNALINSKLLGVLQFESWQSFLTSEWLIRHT